MRQSSLVPLVNVLHNPAKAKGPARSMPTKVMRTQMLIAVSSPAFYQQKHKQFFWVEMVIPSVPSWNKNTTNVWLLICHALQTKQLINLSQLIGPKSSVVV
jgi:hypothetical protein